jgi:hypothetical protein
MRSPLLGSQGTALAITAVAILIFTANVTIINAQQPLPQSTQQQQQPPTSQPAVTQNQTSLFQSTQDGFRVEVPQGWVVQDMDNTGFSLLTEVLQGYGVLAQICPEQQQALRNVGGSSCQASQDSIYIVRYPNLGARLGIASEDIIANSNNTLDNILAYEIQKLQEVGYRDIKIVNSTYTTVNFDTNTGAAARAPAKFVEITYTTDSAPNEIRTGYFISTATNVTPHNLGMITGYSILYEGNSAAETAASGSLAPTLQLAAPVTQVFDSFELIAGQEAVQAAPQAPQPEQTQETTDNNNNDENNNDENNNDENSKGGTSNCEGKVHGSGASGPCDDYDETADDKQTNSDNNDNARVHGSGAKGVNADYDETADDKQSTNKQPSCGQSESDC